MKGVSTAIGCGLLAAVMLACLAPQPALADDTCADDGKNHSVILGKRGDGDKLLNSTLEKVKSNPDRVVNAKVAFPASSLNGSITYIELLDQAKDHKGGCVIGNDGGPGNNYTTIFLESSGHNRSIDFVINVFGIPTGSAAQMSSVASLALSITVLFVRCFANA